MSPFLLIHPFEQNYAHLYHLVGAELNAINLHVPRLRCQRKHHRQYYSCILFLNTWWLQRLLKDVVMFSTYQDYGCRIIGWFMIIVWSGIYVYILFSAWMCSGEKYGFRQHIQKINVPVDDPNSLRLSKGFQIHVSEGMIRKLLNQLASKSWSI